MSSLTNFKPTFTAGHVKYFLGDVNIDGYVKCDNSVLSKTTYPELMTNIGLVSNVAVSNTLVTLDSPSDDIVFDSSNNKFVFFNAATSSYGGVVTSTDFIEIRKRNQLTGSVKKLSKGNGIYVAVDNAGAVFRSEDGYSWEKVTVFSGTPSPRSVTFGDGKFVIGGTVASIATTTDAYTWTFTRLAAQYSTTTTATINNFPVDTLQYGNGVFIAASGQSEDYTLIFTSTNGSTWTQRLLTYVVTVPPDIEYGNSLFLMNLNEGTLYTSTNGTSWTLRNSVFQNSNMQFGKNNFIVFKSVNATNYANIARSTNAISWTFANTILPSNTENILSVSQDDNGYYYGTSDAGTFFYSTDFTTWTYKQNPTVSFSKLFYESGVLYGVSTSGIDYKYSNSAVGSSNTEFTIYGNIPSRTIGTPTNAGTYRDVVFGNGVYISAVSSVSNYEKMVYSHDGVNWNVSKEFASQLNHLSFNGTVFIAFLQDSSIYTSTDGLTWTARTSGTTESFVAVKSLSDNKSYYFSSTKIGHSSGGISWSTVTYNSASNVLDFDYLNGVYVISISGVLYKTTNILDPNTYVQVDYGGSETIEKFLSKDGYMFLKTSSNVFVSKDCINWVKIVSDSSIRGFTYGNNRFVYSTTSNRYIKYIDAPFYPYNAQSHFIITDTYSIFPEGTANQVAYIKT